METIAVYRETRIKTYGFKGNTGMSLFRFRLAPGGVEGLGRRLQLLEDPVPDFYFVLVESLGPKTLQVDLLFKSEEEGELTERLSGVAGGEEANAPEVISPVELIYFYGPHFGDRYGIAHTTFEALRRKKIPVLAAGFSGAAIYLVFPEGMGEAARTALSQTFLVPGSRRPPMRRHGVGEQAGISEVGQT